MHQRRIKKPRYREWIYLWFADSKAMTGELKEWSTSVPTGETHYFDFDLYRNCADTNLQLPVKLIEEVDKVYPTIKSLNTIEMEEGK